ANPPPARPAPPHPLVPAPRVAESVHGRLAAALARRLEDLQARVPQRPRRRGRLESQINQSAAAHLRRGVTGVARVVHFPSSPALFFDNNWRLATATGNWQVRTG